MKDQAQRDMEALIRRESLRFDQQYHRDAGLSAPAGAGAGGSGAGGMVDAAAGTGFHWDMMAGSGVPYRPLPPVEHSGMVNTALVKPAMYGVAAGAAGPYPPAPSIVMAGHGMSGDVAAPAPFLYDRRASAGMHPYADERMSSHRHPGQAARMRVVTGPAGRPGGRFIRGNDVYRPGDVNTAAATTAVTSSVSAGAVTSQPHTQGTMLAGTLDSTASSAGAGTSPIAGVAAALSEPAPSSDAAGDQKDALAFLSQYVSQLSYLPCARFDLLP